MSKKVNKYLEIFLLKFFFFLIQFKVGGLLVCMAGLLSSLDDHWFLYLNLRSGDLVQ